jgi:hypothetical protein
MPRDKAYVASRVCTFAKRRHIRNQRVAVLTLLEAELVFDVQVLTMLSVRRRQLVFAVTVFVIIFIHCHNKTTFHQVSFHFDWKKPFKVEAHLWRHIEQRQNSAEGRG